MALGNTSGLLMKNLITTQDVPSHERFSFFRDTVRSRFLSSYDCDPGQGRMLQQPFYANLVQQRVLDLQFLLLESNAHQASSKPRALSCGQGGDFYIELQRSGAGQLTQDGRTAFLRQGDFCFCDMSRAVSWRFESDYSLYKILIPREKISSKLGNTHNLTAKAVRGNSVSGSLVYSFVMKYVPFLDLLSPQRASQLSDILLNLIVSALSELSEGSPVQPCGHTTIFFIAQDYLERHLSDPDLSIHDCAQKCGISTRYLQKLFQEQGTTVNKWIQNRRMENYKCALTDPLLAEKNITQIAYDCGFSYISNLSRKFKAENMVTPSEYRRTHLARLYLFNTNH
ncbi:helix-turn-helix domain-containing protein [Escherichia albertii]|uniref:helix-turn-helix domain-containing protein n=2 Tax=Escherichia albertii TaxID=208962 RepID=UPI001F14B468|nr:helix-turn-helix domain-containing protein [Escherichia albertii]